MTSVKELREKLNTGVSRYNYLQDTLSNETKKLSLAEQHLRDVVEAQKLVQAVAEAIQQKVHRRIASVVTRCLKTIFGEDSYEFRILFTQRRGKTEANLQFVRDGKAIDYEAVGGGVIDISALALRIAALKLSHKRPFLALDEPCKHLSHGYRPIFRKMLMALARDFGLQILMVTHSPEFVCGKVVSIEENNNGTLA